MKLLPDTILIFLRFITVGTKFRLVFPILFAMNLTDIHVIHIVMNLHVILGCDFNVGLYKRQNIINFVN